MTKQEAYAELHRRVTELNQAERDLQQFAKENGLMMGRSMTRPFELECKDPDGRYVNREDAWCESDYDYSDPEDNWLSSSVCW